VRLPLLLDLPGRDEAREAAQRELAHHAYRAAQPPWYVRLVNWLLTKLNELLDKASAKVPGGGWGLVVLVLLVGVLMAVVLVRLRPARRAGGPVGLFEGELELSASEHRERAERAAASGDHVEAVCERFRAVVRELESRGVLDPRPGRTADEVAREAAVSLPELRAALTRGADLFDEVRYGGRPAGSPSYAVVVDLDERVQRARLVLA
jgi:hypothetical protein